MILKIKIKNADDLIGLKEAIAYRLDGIVEIIRIDVESEENEYGRAER